MIIRLEGMISLYTIIKVLHNVGNCGNMWSERPAQHKHANIAL